MDTTLRTVTLSAVAGLLVALGLMAGASGCSSSTSTPDSTGSTPGRSDSSPSSDSSSSRDALQSYIEANRSAVRREADRYSDVYSDFSIQAEGSRTLVYTYTYRNQRNADSARSQLDELNDTFQSTADVIFPEMEAAGVKDPVIKWVYHNADGVIITTIEAPQ